MSSDIHAHTPTPKRPHAQAPTRPRAQVRYALISWLFYVLDAFMHTVVGSEGLGQHVTHHGGDPITAAHLWHARRLMWKHTIVSPWRQGAR